MVPFSRKINCTICAENTHRDRLSSTRSLCRLPATSECVFGSRTEATIIFPKLLDAIAALLLSPVMKTVAEKSPIRICVYCGSQSGQNPAYREAAHTLGQSMARAGIELVYGGGTNGLMGAVADAVMSGGGKVTGIIPEFLVSKEATSQALTKIDDLIVTKNMHERKHLMFDKSDAFVALPGGIGTLEELIEIMTWAQLGRHSKPIVFADIEGFWQPLKTLITHMGSQGFIHTAHLVQPLVISDPSQIVPFIQAAISETNPDAAAVMGKL